MNIVTSQPATAAPATGGTPVEGFSPEMGGYSENLASQPNNDAELPSGEKAARFEREVVPLHEVLSSGCIFTSVSRANGLLRCCPTGRERGDIALAPRGGQAAVGDVGEGNPRAIWRSLMRIRGAVGDDD